MDEYNIILSLVTVSYLGTAWEFVIKYTYASPAMLQRELHINYEKASAIIDLLELNGFISEEDGAKPRNILISNAETKIQELQSKLKDVQIKKSECECWVRYNLEFDKTDGIDESLSIQKISQEKSKLGELSVAII